MDKIAEYIKNNRDVAAFLAEAARGRLSHAYLVSAADAETVTAALNIMAKACLCPEGGCGACNTCLRIDRGNHANVRRYSEYSAEVVRSIISATYLQSPEDGASVFLLDSFNGVSQSAQNKLLKTLEEPSENVIIILGTTSSASILKTILSRVNKISLNIWDRERIAAALIDEGADTEEARRAAALCPDSLTDARKAVGGESVKNAYEEMREVIVKIERSNEIPRFLAAFGDTNTELTARLDALEAIFSSALRDAANGVITEINSKFNIAALTNILESIADAKAKAKVNVNAQNTANALLMDVLELRYRTAK